MRSEIRRVIAIEAYRRRIGRCPTSIQSLGTGEAFAVAVEADGFTDVASGIRARGEAARIVLPREGTAIDLAFDGDTTFQGHDPQSGERFSGRTGAGASVTVYEDRGNAFFQYAVVDEGR